MIIFRLSEEEKVIVQEYFKTSPIPLIRYKAQAVIMKDNGLRVNDIASSLLRSPRTVTRWLVDFSKCRLASLFSGMQDNQNSAKLTLTQKQQIQTILMQPPSVYRLPKEFWDVPSLKKYVRAEFGVVYESDRSYHYLLQFSNFSFKQPDVFDVRRDEQLINTRMKEIRREVIPLINQDDWVVLASDETRIMLEAITRRAWMKKGERTVLKVERNHESQYYIGFLNIQTGQDHLIPLTWGNEKEIIRALEYVTQKLYPTKRVCILWDNASFHKGKALREKLGTGQSLERVHLMNFPPYAPDHNPQEQVWNQGKKHIANRQYKTFAATKRSFTQFVSKHTFDYTI